MSKYINNPRTGRRIKVGGPVYRSLTPNEVELATVKEKYKRLFKKHYGVLEELMGKLPNLVFNNTTIHGVPEWTETIRWREFDREMVLISSDEDDIKKLYLLENHY